MRRLTQVSALMLALALLTGCTAGRAFRRGEVRSRLGDWDTAVAYYRQAVQADPNKPEYRIALERAMLNASHIHFDNARQLEEKDQLDAALLEYRRTAEFDPANRQAADKAVQLERIIRDRIEASRPKPPIAEIREQARLVNPEPLLNPRSRDPIRVQFTQASLRDVLNFIGNAAGINITFDTQFQDRIVPSVSLTGVPLEQALNTILTSNGLFYTVLDSATIVVAPDSPATRSRYERLIAITIPLSYGDSTELAQMLTQITRTTGASPPIIVPNKTNNSITVRATQPVIDVIRELLASNDKPRAEVTLDIEILEVNRDRVKQLGLKLSPLYQIGGIFSPDQAPPGALGAQSGVQTGAPFNLNTISQGVSTADFYLSVPQAIVRFLETDTRTKVLAQTQLRGAEGGQPLTLKIGAREPYLTTTFSPIATGGANVNPLSSYAFEDVGINVAATPRVTDEGDVLLAPLTLRNSALGPARSVGGSPAPSFTNREVTTTLRLRDGESHLLAGLLRDEDRKSLTGFPGLISVPVLRDLFSDTDTNIQQTDIVMLITPRIIRTHEYTAKDLSPIYLGTNQNFGLTGPPPLIAAPPEATQPPVAPPPAAGPPQGIPVPTVPQGGTPGQVTTPGVPPPPQASGPAPQATAVGPLGEPQINLTQPQSPTTTTLAPTAQVSVTAPTGDVRVAGGPYMVPVYINGVSRVSTITVTLTYNPGALRVRTIQQGNFLGQGNATVSFTPNTDRAIGRVDLTFVRTGDTVGASGSGLLAGIMFDAVGAGTSQLTISGVATNPTGGAIPLQFSPATLVVR